MAIIGSYTQQPADRLDYDFNYSDFLGNMDSIVSAELAVEPVEAGGAELEGVVVEPTFVKVWVKGGNSGTTYKVTCTATTQRGRVKQAEIKIRLREY